MKLILTRHGETVENVKGIFQGEGHGKLSKNGLSQAKKLAKRLAKEKFDVIYSSDLRRAAQTAKEIKKYHPKTSIFFVKELRERDVGSMTGKPVNLIKNERDLPKDAEKIQAVYKRAKDFLEKILKKHKNKTVLFVCHGNIGHAIVCAINKKSYKNIDPLELKNTSVSVFDIRQDKSHKIHLYNCVKHLE